jgi:hypothetical protein
MDLTTIGIIGAVAAVIIIYLAWAYFTGKWPF